VSDDPDALLQVNHLFVKFFTRRGTVHAVRDVSFHINRGETLGLVGESGSGKSVTAQALMGLIDLPGKITGGDVLWKGQSLLGESTRLLRQVRGKDIAMVFQDPMTSLNPLFTVGAQIGEVLRRHLGMNRRQAVERATELLAMVGLSNPRQRVDQHPHELSGGMRQRALIAMSLACEPELLIADEPTTALDVTIQAQILELIADLQQRLGLAVLMITHDLGVVAGLCDRVAVMYAGKVVEVAAAEELFHRPAHPYTAGLLRSTPRLDIVIPRLISIEGAPPDLVSPPVGCAFADRCHLATDECRDSMPGLHFQTETRKVACWRPFEASANSAPEMAP
jgi:oligopeptide/dipeptide ABC transporter ATP-binding protein